MLLSLFAECCHCSAPCNGTVANQSGLMITIQQVRSNQALSTIALIYATLNMMRKSVLSVHTVCCVYIDLQALWFCAELEKSANGPEPALGQPHADWSGVIF